MGTIILLMQIKKEKDYFALKNSKLKTIKSEIFMLAYKTADYLLSL